MNQPIDGVVVRPLAEFPDVRGSVRRVLREDDEHFTKFGEVYFSNIWPGVLKAWHVHKRMTLRYVVAFGQATVGLVDMRPDSPTVGNRMLVHMADSGPLYCMLTIPPGVANGFRCAPEWASKVVMLNCADMTHDPEEIVRHHPRNLYPDFPWGDYALAG